MGVYSKHSWVANEVITAAKMNNIENGVKQNDTEIGLASNVMNYILIPVEKEYTWEAGGLSIVDGTTESSSSKIRVSTAQNLSTAQGLKYSVPDNFKLLIFWYGNAVTGYLGYTEVEAGQGTAYYSSQAQKYNLVLLRTNNEALAVNEIPAKLMVTPLTITDTTLTKISTIADAKATGDALATKISKNGDTINGNLIFPATKNIILEAPNGTRYRLTVANDGTLNTSEVE